jgi:hypothetical protein
LAKDQEVQRCLDDATETLVALEGHVLDVLSIRKPLDPAESVGWMKIVSKLSPILGNLLEFEIVRLLNALRLPDACEWIRQDPGFPDAALLGLAEPSPGIEIKAWFPLATEITGRFRESQTRLLRGDVRVAIIAWIPEYVLFGRPIVLGSFVEDALDIATARDDHYFQPPRYLVREPEDTSTRTVNLQQTITNGFRCQETGQRLKEVENEVSNWSSDFRSYRFGDEVQSKIRSLLSRYNYRLDTNFAKIDRIDHQGIEEFKAKILNTKFHGKPILEWSKSFVRTPDIAADEIMQLAESAPD